MAKKAKIVDEPIPEKVAVEKVEPKVSEKVEVKVAVGTGKYVIEAREGGAVVLNKEGKCISNVMAVNKALKTAENMNRIDR
jgi:hypothetical protein